MSPRPYQYSRSKNNLRAYSERYVWAVVGKMLWEVIPPIWIDNIRIADNSVPNQDDVTMSPRS
jgi:hypothetical protein